MVKLPNISLSNHQAILAPANLAVLYYGRLDLWMPVLADHLSFEVLDTQGQIVHYQSNAVRIFMSHLLTELQIIPLAWNKAQLFSDPTVCMYSEIAHISTMCFLGFTEKSEPETISLALQI